MAQIKIIVNGKECFGEAGKTILAIAAENGIEIDLNSVVQAQFGEEILAVVREVLTECGVENASLRIADFAAIRSEFDSLMGQSFSYKGEIYALPLLGSHQLKNAAVVLETVEVLRKRGWKLEQSDVEHGIYAVSWPGRFELICDEPEFIVDGGHNPQCIEALVKNIVDYLSGRRVIALTGVLADKDYAARATDDQQGE